MHSEGRSEQCPPIRVSGLGSARGVSRSGGRQQIGVLWRVLPTSDVIVRHNLALVVDGRRPREPNPQRRINQIVEVVHLAVAVHEGSEAIRMGRSARAYYLPRVVDVRGGTE